MEIARHKQRVEDAQLKSQLDDIVELMLKHNITVAQVEEHHNNNYVSKADSFTAKRKQRSLSKLRATTIPKLAREAKAAKRNRILGLAGGEKDGQE